MPSIFKNNNWDVLNNYYKVCSRLCNGHDCVDCLHNVDPSVKLKTCEKLALGIHKLPYI